MPAATHTRSLVDRLDEELVHLDLFGPSETPLQVGRFEVLRKLGAGGMGAVYEANDPTLDRRVALKLLLPDLCETSGDARRLLREATAMARLSHPHVVQVYEVGEHEGQLFLAMEYVEGGTLRKVLAPGAAPWREVLGYYLQAGHGLHAAHTHGLVHRDFKPENVLIARADRRAKVVDFGLAGLPHSSASRTDLALPLQRYEDAPDLSNRRTALTRWTCSGALLGTPAYMSPEQHLDRAADARSDQFSYCVALFEGLFGRRPFPEERLDALRSSICAGRITPVQRLGGVPRRVLRALLRGLSRDPDRRWPSMAALLAELERAAQPHTRRWWSTAALAAVLGAFGAPSSPEPPSRCETSAARLAGVWDAARRQELRAAFLAVDRPYAETVLARTEELLDGYARTWSEAHAETCAAIQVHNDQTVERLASRATCLERRRIELLGLVEVLAHADAETVDRAVQAASNLPPVASCSAIAAPREALSLRAEVRAQLARVHAQLAEARALRDAGKPRQALPIAEAAVVGARALGETSLLAEALLRAGELKERSDAAAAAEALYEAASLATAAGYDRLAARAWIRLVWLTGGVEQRFPEASVLARVAEAALQRGEPEPLDLADLENHRGNVAFLRSDFAGAVAHHRRALALREAALGSTHPVVAKSLVNLGAAYSKLEQLEDAEAQHRRVLDILGATVGPDHVDAADVHNNLGIALELRGDFVGAIAEYRRAMQIWSDALGAEHPSSATASINLGIALRHRGELSGSDAALRRALAIRERVHGSRHMALTNALNNLAMTRAALGDLVEARQLLERSLQIKRDALGERHGSLAPELANLGTISAQMGARTQAIALTERARALNESTLGPAHPAVAANLQALSALLREEGRLQEALERAQRAVEILEPLRNGAHRELPGARIEHARVLLALRQPDAARAPLERALAALPGDGDPRVRATALFALAQVFQAMKSGERARSLAEEARGLLAGEADVDDLVTAREIEAWLAHLDD